MPRVRCCNVDWLEVFAYEPIERPQDANFFRSLDWQVIERDYGTRVFTEMFTLCDNFSQGFIEIRRAPASRNDLNGILPPNAVHLRLTNRTCYLNNAGQLLADFMDKYGYEFKRIARIDVCLDFERFDSGDYPEKFLARYLKGQYRKINQCRIHIHGNDCWSGQEYNSCSWGAKSSQVGTKLYNKTLELKQAKDKPYIRQAWFEAGLVAHPVELYQVGKDGNRYYPDIWRLEFSIKSARNGWYTIEENGKDKKKHSFRHNLDLWHNRDACWALFRSLIPHYFRFKYYEEGKRKDRCRDKVLFEDVPQDQIYHLENVAVEKVDNSLEQQLIKLLNQYGSYCTDMEAKSAVNTLVNILSGQLLLDDYDRPFDKALLLALQETIRLRLNGSQEDPANMIKSLTETYINYQNEIF